MVRSVGAIVYPLLFWLVICKLNPYIAAILSFLSFQSFFVDFPSLSLSLGVCDLNLQMKAASTLFTVHHHLRGIIANGLVCTVNRKQTGRQGEETVDYLCCCWLLPFFIFFFYFYYLLSIRFGSIQMHHSADLPVFVVLPSTICLCHRCIYIFFPSRPPISTYVSFILCQPRICDFLC